MKIRREKQGHPADAQSLPPKVRFRHPVLPAVDEADLPPEARKQVHTLQAFSERLIEENNGLWEENAQLKDEVAVLKGEKKRPVFKPSRMNEEAGKADPAQEKRPKTSPARWINETKQDRAARDPLR